MATTEINALQTIAWIIIESVAEEPRGVPGGTIYAALMSIGLSIDQFEQIMETLVKLNFLRKSGQLYFAVDRSEISN